MRARSKGDVFEDATLNLAPMIDVVFLLLVFFMVASTFSETETEIPVDLPAAETGEESETEDDELIITLDADGGITMNGRSYTEDSLLTALEQAADRNPDVLVTIRGDEGIDWGRGIGVMDLCRTAGLLDIGIQTRDQQ
jgi:biopolymer transport protein ExbD